MLTKARSAPLALFAALSVVGLAACGGSSGSAVGASATATSQGSASAPTSAASAQSGTASGKGKKVALIVGTSSDDFYKAIECGAKLEAKKQGVVLNVQGPSQFDPALQVPIVNAVSASQPDAIIIAPTDDTALYPPLKAAADAGAKILFVDTTLKNAGFGAGHIGSDYVLYGQQGAQQVAQLTGDKGTVLGIFSPPGVSTNDLGRKGFSQEMSKHQNIKVLPFEYSSGAPGKSAAILSAVLAAHPDLTGVFTFNGGDSEGVVTGLRQARAAGKVSFVSGDAQPFQVQQLKAGLVKALVVQQARQMGILSIQNAIKALAGESVAPETALPTVVGTSANLATPEVADNLYQGC